MFVTIITSGDGPADVRQVEAPTVKDCLVAWAGKVGAGELPDERRTRLRGDMADFDPNDHQPLPGVWRLETDLGRGDGSRVRVYVVETVRP